MIDSASSSLIGEKDLKKFIIHIESNYSFLTFNFRCSHTHMSINSLPI